LFCERIVLYTILFHLASPFFNFFKNFSKKILIWCFLSSLPFFQLCCKLKMPSRGDFLAHGD